MSTPHADDLLGQTIGSYVIVARVGGGGMGVVYQARDTKLGRTVALKFLPPQWSHDEDARLRFMREAQAASATNHPNICTIHDISTAPDGQLFIVMAYYDGQTLKQRLASGPLPVEEALDIATQIADGLARAHAQGVVHRDVKPGNVILTEDGVRIVDFGLATFSDALKLTVEHSTLGTAAYMSPEQVRGQSADTRSDVWSVGVILYEMLTGQVPFQGSHAEAIAYAVRNETPAPIRTSRPEMGEEIEQLVFRALHKEPSVRFKDGRELARALRQGRGQSLPLDLRTTPVPVPPPAQHRRDNRRSSQKLWAGAAAVSAALGVAGLWWGVSGERRVVAVVPIVNETGHDSLAPYRMALTNALLYALADSATVRVVGHDELSAVIRRFRVEGRDVSSTEVLQAVAANTAAELLIVPTILKEGDRWKARIEFRNSQTATTDAVEEIEAGVSVLVKESAYGMVAPLVEGIERHVARLSWRARLTEFLHRSWNRASSPHPLPVSTLDAAAAFEHGVDRYEELEFSSAATFFDSGSKEDPLSPLLVAWRSRVASILRKDVEAVQLARQALSLISDATPETEKLFVQAVAAESSRDAPTAEARYRSLAARHPDDPAFVMELAAFQDRRGINVEAVKTYLQALALERRLVRPLVELCRLYNRLNNPTAARQHAETAVTAFRALGASGGEAQARFCLTESLRRGDENEQAEALNNAEAALKTFQQLQYRDNLARAYHYVALALEAQGRLDEAVTSWDQSLPIARQTNNNLLATNTLMNLGATNERLGHRSKAIEFLRQSAQGFEALGDQVRAAQNQFNIGAILVEHGGGWKEGLADVRGSLAVFEEYRDVNFQVAAKQVIATYYRYAGRRQAAESELSQALAMALREDLDYEIATTQIRRAQVLMDGGEYEGARRLLAEVLEHAGVRDGIEGRIVMARALLKEGDFIAAADALSSARRQLGDSRDAGLRPALYAVSGELAYEMRNSSDARRHFRASTDFLTEALADPDAALARAYSGLLDADEGRFVAGRESIERTLDTARRMGHISLEARCRVYLARLYLLQGRTQEALNELHMAPGDDSERAIDRELRAQVHYWTSQALKARGDASAASEEAETARKRVEELAAKVPEARRETFRSRPDIEKILK